MQDAVRSANTEFYRAFESLSLEAMDGIWSHSEDVRCVHPGWSELHGWKTVRESWEAIFKGASYMEFNISDLQIWEAPELACVFCHENILSFRDGQEVRSVVLATNLYRKEQDRWLMVLHHGSPVLTKPAAE